MKISNLKTINIKQKLPNSSPWSCSRPHPTWPWTLSGIWHLLLWKTCSSASRPLSQKTFFLMSNVNLPSFSWKPLPLVLSLQAVSFVQLSVSRMDALCALRSNHSVYLWLLINLTLILPVPVENPQINAFTWATAAGGLQYESMSQQQRHEEFVSVVMTWSKIQACHEVCRHRL